MLNEPISGNRPASLLGPTIEVVANNIDTNFITFKCPKCNLFHQHDSSGLVHKRIEPRVTYCPLPYFPKKFFPVKIVINENTRGYEEN